MRFSLFFRASVWLRCPHIQKFFSIADSKKMKGIKMKLHQKIGAALAAMVVASPAFAVSIVDYTGIMTQVTSELTLGIAAAAVGIGLIWGARVGIRFVKSLLV